MNIYKGIAPKSDYQKLMDMLDLTFFANDDEPARDFLSLLPCLYKPEYDPCSKNYVVKEDDEMCAAVGFYTYNVQAAGEKLVFSGIGNVAVHPDHRSKGYMIDCMNGAIEEMSKLGADVSLLGGQKQRYGYFGYEPAGIGAHFEITKTNLRHVFGKDAKSGLTVKEVGINDSEELEFIASVYKNKPFYVERPQSKLYDILCSGNGTPYIVLDGDKPVGYFAFNRYGSVSEFGCKFAKDAGRVAMAIIEFKDVNIKIHVPVFDREIINELLKVCEGDGFYHPEMFMILNFENTVRAFLKVRATYEKLSDGETTLLIHGTRGDEQIKIKVTDNDVSVTKCSGDYDMELEALEATRLLFSINSVKRDGFTPAVRSWLPLPIYCYSCDAV
ncbi:MAG: GNAT family N-acetyltransferase [Clostridia bacterium]|nr:GNAT family N-acetyltransferase [Clostridia bacterium]